MLNYIRDILAICDYLCKLSTKFHLHKLILVILIAVGVNIYFYFFIYQKNDKTEYTRTTEEVRVIEEINKTLNECGQYSFGTWATIDSDFTFDKEGRKRDLIFKIARSCQRDRAESASDCTIDISKDNPIYLETHPIRNRTLKFIEDSYEMKDGRMFTELSPICFNLLDKEGNLSSDAKEIELNAPDFYKIIQDTNLAVRTVCVIKVKHKIRKGKPVVYIFTISFVAISEKSCSLNKNGKQIGDYLILIANKSKKLLE